MKKVLKGVLIALGVILLVGMVGCVASVALVGTAVDETITEMEQEIEENNATYDELVQAVEWNTVTDEFGLTTVTGVLTNTTDKEIDYIEVEYKFIKDGVVVDSSFINATDIQAGESVKLDIMTVEEFDSFEVKGTDIWD